jgi:Carbohydrate binding module (family 6)
LDNGDWVKYSGLDFGAGVSRFIARVGVDAAFAGQKLELHLDSLTGPLLGTLTVASTNGFENYTTQITSVSGASGVHDLFLVAKGGAGIANVDLFYFRR